MKKVMGIIIILLISFYISSFTLEAADNDYLYNLLYHDITDRFDLKVSSLRLPYEENAPFSLQVQNKLSNLAAKYSGKIIDSNSGQSLTFEEKTEEEINIKLLPGVLLNADYQENVEDSRVLKNTNISLLYKIGDIAEITAEYGRLEKEWWDIREINLVEEEPSDENPSSGEETDTGEEEDNEEDKDDNSVYEEIVYNEEQEEEGRLGISFKTNDRLTLTADLVSKGLIDEKDLTTIFGLEYKDKLGKVKYEYQIDMGKEKQTISGLKLGYKDLATFNASYKLLNPDELKSRLQETTWDFGLDVNLSELSSISIGYQLISNEEYNENMELDNQEKESNIQAKLEYKF